MDLPLIGRDDDAAALKNLVVGAPVVLVHGAAGVGKTALVRAALEPENKEGTTDAPRLPRLVRISVEGIENAWDALERTALALAIPFRRGGGPALEDELVRLLVLAPVTVVWDDVDLATLAALTDLVRLVTFAAEARVGSRLVLVSRRIEATLGARIPLFEVKPLSRGAAVELVRAVEAARGRSLAEDIAAATAGNPRMIQTALSGDGIGGRVGDDAGDVRRAIETHRKGPGGVILALLVAGGIPLDEAELQRAAGKGALVATDELRRNLVVVRDGDRLALSRHAEPIAREVLGDVGASTWRLLARAADRMLEASKDDEMALVAGSRARLEQGDAPAAFALLKSHPTGRGAADAGILTRLLRDLAARAPEGRMDALGLLVREQLRRADYEEARRTLEDLPKVRTPKDAERVALLRAECHVRAGDPEAAQHALDEVLLQKRTKEVGPALKLALVQLAILRGEHAAARALAESLAPKTARVPSLESRRAVEIAASWLYEERYEHAHEWLTRARAQRVSGIPVDAVITLLDVHALLGLGLVDRAAEVTAREAGAQPIASILELAILSRRGEASRAVSFADTVLAALGRRSDLLLRSVVARDLTRSAIAIGDLGLATRMMRIAEAGADEPGLAALRPICDAEEARLALARGDLARATERIDRAKERSSSPFVAVDHAVIHGSSPIVGADGPPVLHAYAALRVAEASLAAGNLEEATTRGEQAVGFYSEATLHYEAARALLVVAESLAIQSLESGGGETELGGRAERALEGCLELALPRGYAFVLVEAWLVRAALSEARGLLDASAEALGQALRLAGESADGMLVAAARRAGASVDEIPPSRQSSRGLWSAAVERLGLARPADVVWRVGPRAWLRSNDDPPPAVVSCSVDVEARRVQTDDGRTLVLPEQRIALLCALAESGTVGATLEDLFARVWKGTFHPLRHRNAVYVALARLKESLKPLADDVALAHDGERYRLVGRAPVGVRRAAFHAA